MGKQLDELEAAPFFNPSLDQYVTELSRAVKELLSRYDTVPKPVCLSLLEGIWAATKFLVGSISKTIPYEFVYSLTKALSDWSTERNLITTALSDNCFDFHFLGVPQDFSSLIKNYLGVELSYNLIQIALPKMYRQKPLYSVPLYHELGHFIDTHLRIAFSTMLKHPAPPGVNGEMEIRHRMEFFADLFAVSYTGEANIISLENIAKDNPKCFTHPATVDRVAMMDDFIQGRNNSTVDMLQESLRVRAGKELKIQYVAPLVEEFYNNIRPYKIASELELHGILESSWKYMANVLTNRPRPWSEIPDIFESERIVSDLTEKSIRNYMLMEKWTDGIA